MFDVYGENVWCMIEGECLMFTGRMFDVYREKDNV